MAYQTEAQTEGAGPTAVAVHCSDPRYQRPFQEFLRGELGLERYAPVAVPGGAHLLARGGEGNPAAAAGWQWLEFLVALVKPERIVLIAHHDCRWYLDRGLAHAAGQRATLAADLRRAREELAQRFPGTRVELYYATLSAAGARFDTVE